MALPTTLKRRLVQDLPDTVHRVAAQVPTAALSPETIFTIDNGPILVHHIIGRVTVALDATTTSVDFDADPTVGAVVALTAAAVVTSDAAGTRFRPHPASGQYVQRPA